ncbi:MAG: hypothetical protein AABN34_17675 [Acidobacteriota bacterium]
MGLRSALFVILALVALGLIYGINRATSQERKEDKERATEIQIGVMSSTQREHSKLYSRYQPGRRLDITQPGLKPGQEEGVYVEAPLEITSDDAPVVTFKDFLTDLTCGADLIVVATPTERTSQLTENREFVFSDYTAVVEEVLKNNPSAQITPNSGITVTRPGGRVSIGGRVVSAFDSSFKPLERGLRYLLFLKYVPKTGAYDSIVKGSFLLNDKELLPLTEQYIPTGDSGVRSLSPDVRNILTSTCKK